MSEGTTPGQGLFLQSYCISTVPGGQKEDDCRDTGGRATQGAVAEVDRVGRRAGTQEVRATQEQLPEQRSRAMHGARLQGCRS